MANIRVDVNYTIKDGSEVSFTAPCDCTAVTGLKVYHQGGSKEFTFVDSHGNDLSLLGHLFASGAIVKVILDVSNAHAYIQNPDTNAYLENRIKKAAPVNLLDNSDFTNLVAQAGYVKTHGGTITYFADRWYIDGNARMSYDESSRTITFPGGGTAILVQKFAKNISGKTVTLAIKAGNVSGDVFLSEYGAESGHGDIKINNGVTVHTFTGAEAIILWSGVKASLTIDWVALYEGVYTAETLPEYHPKGYAHELMECQRYYQQDLTSNCTVTGMFDGTGCLDVMVPLQTTMRTIPTVNCIAYASGVAQGDNTIRLTVENTDPQTVSCSYQWKSTNFISPRYINGSYAWKKAIVTFRYTAAADL